MSSNLRKVWGGFILGAVSATGANAQNWSICADPDASPYRSVDFGRLTTANTLMRATLGTSGTVQYFGPNSICAPPTTAVTANMRGRIGFAVGSQGSVQTPFDNGMSLTFGMPEEPAGTWSYACLTVVDPTDGSRTNTTYGANGLSLAFVGASNRYIKSESVNDGVRITCQMDIFADATRLQWSLLNQGDPRPIGLWFGQWVAIFSGQVDPATNAQVASGPLAQKAVFVDVPGQKPPLIRTRYIRSQMGGNFPQHVDFNFGQSTPYGMRVETGPTPATTNPQTQASDADQASEIVVGHAGELLGAPDGGDGEFPDGLTPDQFIGANTCAYILKFPETTIATNSTNTIVHYVRSTWGRANYILPYAAVVDAPRLLATDDDGSGSQETNGLFKNPFPVRVYVDNVGGYGDINNGFPIQDVQIKLTLPVGLNFVGESPSLRSKTLGIQTVAWRAIENVDFQVEADGIEFGDLPISIEINSIPGPKKTIAGSIQVAATPRYRLYSLGGPTANAITTPFVFADSSWTTVLGLSTPSQFQAFEWDPQLKGYVISTSASRGKGAFIVNNTGSTLSAPLGGSPVTPPDTPPNPGDNTGRVVIQLKSGWNLIGNPYNYPITIGQMTGVSAANPQVSRPWSELVSTGVVNSAISYWNALTQSYKFLQKSTDKLLPNIGYWVFVNTSADLSLSFPPVFEPGLPGSTRSADDWIQSDKQWRLQIVARNDRAIDDQNFIGLAQSTANATNLRVMEPPMAPTQELAVSAEAVVNGQLTRLAQNLSDKPGKQEFKVLVNSTTEGEVHLTWPNLSTIPKNVRLRLVDEATSTSRDMRTSSGYTFNATANSTREFKVQMDIGGAVRAVIGNLVVTRSGRDRNSPFTINYTLSSAASTTIRILGNNGKEVFTVTRGRADNAGENSATWNLKDNANRSVAPGTYRVEIVATTSEGDNVRRIVPVNVIR